MLQNNYTKEILALLESSRTHNRFPNLGIWQRDGEPPGNLTLVTSGIWLQNFHRTGVTDSGKAQTKPCAHQDPGEWSSDPTRDWPRPACECPAVSSGGVGRRWPAAGQGPWVQKCTHGAFWRRSPSSSLPPSLFGLRSNNREGTQPRPSTENWVKDLLNLGQSLRLCGSQQTGKF